jgi:hypothetical protein
MAILGLGLLGLTRFRRKLWCLNIEQLTHIFMS